MLCYLFILINVDPYLMRSKTKSLCIVIRIMRVSCILHATYISYAKSKYIRSSHLYTVGADALNFNTVTKGHVWCSNVFTYGVVVYILLNIGPTYSTE